MASTIFLWITLAYFLRVEAIFYDKSSSSLDRLPGDIPDNVDSVDLNDNAIAAIDCFPDLPRLVNLTMALNSLTEFPDLINISDTLRYLDLSSNMITAVQPGRLDQMRVLEVLSLGDNPLSAIPDVPGPSNTLYHLGLGYSNLNAFPLLPNLGKNIWTLYVHGTNIATVPLEAFDYLPNLDYVLLYETGIRELPNMCHTQQKSPMSFDVSYMQFDCNWNFIWLKIAAASKHIIMAGDGPSCRRSDGDNIEWNEVNINKITASGAEEAYYTRMTDNTKYYCPLGVQADVKATPVECARLCLHKTDCALFAIDGDHCILTSLETGNRTAFASYRKWFVVNGK